MSAPIIIPMPIVVNKQTTRDCIVQDGQRYCVQPIGQDLHFFGMTLIAIAVYLIWSSFWVWLSLEKDNIMIAITFCFILPLIVAGFAFLI